VLGNKFYSYLNPHIFTIYDACQLMGLGPNKQSYQYGFALQMQTNLSTWRFSMRSAWSFCIWLIFCLSSFSFSHASALSSVSFAKLNRKTNNFSPSATDITTVLPVCKWGNKWQRCFMHRACSSIQGTLTSDDCLKQCQHLRGD